MKSKGSKVVGITTTSIFWTLEIWAGFSIPLSSFEDFSAEGFPSSGRLIVGLECTDQLKKIQFLSNFEHVGLPFRKVTSPRSHYLFVPFHNMSTLTRTTWRWLNSSWALEIPGGSCLFERFPPPFDIEACGRGRQERSISSELWEFRFWVSFSTKFASFQFIFRAVPRHHDRDPTSRLTSHDGGGFQPKCRHSLPTMTWRYVTAVCLESCRPSRVSVGTCEESVPPGISNFVSGK